MYTNFISKYPKILEYRVENYKGKHLKYRAAPQFHEGLLKHLELCLRTWKGGKEIGKAGEFICFWYTLSLPAHCHSG